MLKTHDLRKLEIADLEKEISSSSKELFKLKLDISSGQEKRGHLVNSHKKYLARIKTIITEKKL